MSVIQLNKISKSFRGVHLFKEASAVFEKGKIHGLVGPNGSGKSVLFRMICGFMLPDRGIIEIDPAYRRGTQGFPDSFGIMIDRPGYLASQTGYENLRRLAQIRGLIGTEEIRRSMKAVGLDPDLRQKMRHYSLGMKQKIALAQSFMEGQQVLVLDEPFNALDERSVGQVRELLMAFRTEGRTILLTSHHRDDIEMLCDEVYRIEDGKLERQPELVSTLT
ncbi:ATP-binding cassette domain-containing protein [Saccharibacillus sacchari]|uniref:ABC transporter ATP-binding protein n=1 Tax=Saccharibacillus sacchari TaxID=456493 RepID=UPI0004AE3F22|nr:ABC transporter ATP-binding protein [Saccharibacillus sacchari]